MDFVKLMPLLLLVITAYATAKSSSNILGEDLDAKSIAELEYDNEIGILSGDESEDSDSDDNEPAKGDMSKEEKDKLIELLSTEGKPGWLKKMAQSNVSSSGSTGNSGGTSHINDEKTAQYTQEMPFQDDPTEAVNALQTKLAKVNDPLATNVKTSLSGLTKKWSSLTDDERSGIMSTVTTITTNFDKFINAGDNPVGAIQGAIDIIGSIASNFGPKGQLLSMGLGFVSSILGLFGKGPKQPSLSEVVRKVINDALDKYHDRSLTDKANGVIKALSDSKAYLDGVAQIGKPLNLEQMKLASSRVPIIQGSVFMGELFSVTNRLFTDNLSKNARKAIKYAELYAKIETLREMILTQFISITSDDKNLQFDVKGLMNLRGNARKGVKALLEKLYVINYDSQILPYFDPDDSPATDMYARTLLNMGKYDRSMAGQYCLMYTDGNDLDWQRDYSQFKLGGRPYTALAKQSNTNCYWKLVPHGNYIYSIVNKYKCKDNYDYCNAMLSWDGYGDSAYVNIDHNDPVLWEIWGYNFRRIRSKWGCNTGHKFCNRELRIANRRITGWDCFVAPRCNLYVGQLLPSDGKYYWRLRKRT